MTAKLPPRSWELPRLPGDRRQRLPASFSTTETEPLLAANRGANEPLSSLTAGPDNADRLASVKRQSGDDSDGDYSGHEDLQYLSSSHSRVTPFPGVLCTAVVPVSFCSAGCGAAIKLANVCAGALPLNGVIIMVINTMIDSPTPASSFTLSIAAKKSAAPRPAIPILKFNL